MKKEIKHFLLIVGMFFLYACAWTTLNSIKNPEFRNKKFTKILIIAPFSDLGVRQSTEEAFKKQFELAGIPSVPSIELFPPIKNYSEEEIMKILRENNIEGILVVALKRYWNSKVYIPKTSSTQGSANLYGNSLVFQTYTRESGGYYITKPRATFEIRLYDANTGKIAWLATSFTRGNAFADSNTLLTSLAKTTVKRLLKENILR